MLSTALLTGGLLFGAAAAHADMDDIEAMKKAEISLSDAIDAAEKATGGKAYSASIDDDSDTPQYEVNTFTGDKTYESKVDAASGEVTDTHEDD